MKLDTQKHSLNYMEEAVKIMRSERHEYLNHLQTIMGLILSGDHKEAMTYLKDMGAECRFNSQVLSVSNPSLRVLLQNKRQSALIKGIELKLTIQSDLKQLKLTPTDTTTIFGNLLDNAMDCIVNAKDNSSRKLIHLKVTEVADDYVFTIEDSGPPIEPHILAEIFKIGFSTKGTGRGFGLALVESTIQRYQGTIHYGVNGAKGFTVTFPQQGVAA
ncbi:sensor histidine kinase [Desulforamulus ruminis]|nr:ATP-binding protein [Desulforamulus ruminis]